MVMADNEGGDDHQNETVSGPKSPWKTTPVIMDAAPVISADSWPALADAQHRPPKPSSDPPLVQVFHFSRFILFSLFFFSF